MVMVPLYYQRHNCRKIYNENLQSVNANLQKIEMSALFEVVYISSMVSTSLPLPINKTKKGQVIKKK